MSTLANFPLISQLTSTSGDGSSPNAAFDCVPSCLCAGAMYLNGIPAMNKEYNPDAFLDMAYPEGYHGGTDARLYIPAMAKLGLKLYPLQANAAQLVVLIHQQLAQRHPVIVTVPDVYAPSSYGWTHVLCAYQDEPGYITMLDPYIGKGIKKADNEWAQLLLNNEIWVMEKLSMNTIPQGWKDDGATLTAPNGVYVQHGFRAFVIANGWHPDNWPLGTEYGTDRLEESNPGLGSGSQQVFRWTMLGYTPQHGVFVEWIGQELVKQRKLTAQYQDQAAALAAQLAAMSKQGPTTTMQTPDPRVAQYASQLTKIGALAQQIIPLTKVS